MLTTIADDSFEVLLVDDDADFRHTVEEAIRALGYQPIPAPSAEDALRLLAERQPDIALVDIRLSRMDGVSFLETLRRSHSRLPVVLMSAYEFAPLMERARDAGFTVFLSKPFSLQQLAGAIVRAMADALDRMPAPKNEILRDDDASGEVAR